MIRFIKSVIQSLFLSFGFKVIKAKEVDELEKLKKWINRFNILSVIDIGANEGQFAHKLRKLLPEAYIHSFEPIPHVFDYLKLSTKNDPNIFVYNSALGNSSGAIEMTLNESTASSSILKLTEDAQEHFKFLIESKNIAINICKLDQFNFKIEIKPPYIIKIDVQGFELEVIKGGNRMINGAIIIIIEVSFKALYKDQVLFDDIYKALIALGFSYSGSVEQLISPLTNEILQADAIFVNKNLYN